MSINDLLDSYDRNPQPARIVDQDFGDINEFGYNYNLTDVNNGNFNNFNNGNIQNGFDTAEDDFVQKLRKIYGNYKQKADRMSRMRNKYHVCVITYFFFQSFIFPFFFLNVFDLFC